MIQKAGDNPELGPAGALAAIAKQEADTRREMFEKEARAICRDEARKIVDEITRLHLLIMRLLGDLPAKRDWLDPDLERELREAVTQEHLKKVYNERNQNSNDAKGQAQ